jgi:hypothetical protein
MVERVELDRWAVLREYLRSYPNTINDAADVLIRMRKIDERQEELDKSYREAYERSKVVIHCSKCGSRMELIPSTSDRKEIICPFAGCGQPTGMSGYFMISAGGRD